MSYPGGKNYVDPNGGKSHPKPPDLDPVIDKNYKFAWDRNAARSQDISEFRRKTELSGNFEQNLIAVVQQGAREGYKASADTVDVVEKIVLAASPRTVEKLERLKRLEGEAATLREEVEALKKGLQEKDDDGEVKNITKKSEDYKSRNGELKEVLARFHEGVDHLVANDIQIVRMPEAEIDEIKEAKGNWQKEYLALVFDQISDQLLEWRTHWHTMASALDTVEEERQREDAESTEQTEHLQRQIVDLQQQLFDARLESTALAEDLETVEARRHLTRPKRSDWE